MLESYVITVAGVEKCLFLEYRDVVGRLEAVTSGNVDLSHLGAG